MPKSIDGLMRYMRDKKGIAIRGSSQKRDLRNIGYYHGYKGYRFIGKSSNTIPYTDFNQLISIYNFDMKLKALLYPQLMFIETALKNCVLEEIIKEGNSENFNYIYTNILTDFKRFAPGSDQQKKAIKKRLALRDRVYSALTKEYNHEKEVVQHFYHKDTSVPIWAIFEILTLGEFGAFFESLNYNVRNAISKNIGLHRASDTDAFMTRKIIYALKELRNAVAHNDVIFDTRFIRSNVDNSLAHMLENATGIKQIKFRNITDYVILVTFMLKCFGVAKRDMKKLVNDTLDCLEELRSNLPYNIYAKIVQTDTRKKLHDLLKFISQ